MILLQCNDYTILPVIKVLKNIFLIIEILAPALAIVSLSILMFRLMVNPQDPSDPRKDNIKLKNSVKNAVISLVIIFLIPVFVNVVMGILGEKFTVSSCWNNADKIKLSSTTTYYDRGKKKTKIINEKTYDQGYTGPSINNTSGASGNVNSTELFQACEEQAQWMKNYHYEWESKPTVEKSKYRGTCVTYVASVLQRIGALKPGKFIWHNGSGYGTGKVFGTTSSMTVKYMNNRPLSDLKSELQPGDIILVDDNKSGKKGQGGHIFIYAGGWDKKGRPMIYDNHSAEKVKSGKSAKHSYSNSRKVLAIVRL